MYHDTIVAIATPVGEGALGVVRLSGQEALAIAQRVFRGRLADHTVHFGRLCDPSTGGVVDEVMATYMAAPHSYTREDTVEFSCHGGPAPLQSALALLLREGARLATPGEFTLRAFLNGRIDLAQAEAVMDMVQARTEQSLQLALRGLSGGLSQRVSGCRSQLLDVLAYVTALVDFPEDEVGRQDITTPLRSALSEIDGLLATAGQGAVFRQGVRVALLGLPNAGKSSLMNRLLGWDRAIVADLPGTTRDTLEETVSLRGIPFVITDTAGITATDDPVELAGVARSHQQAAAADVVLVVADGSRPVSPELSELLDIVANRDTLVIVNKSDLPAAWPENALSGKAAGGLRWVSVSALTGEGIETLVESLCSLVLGGHTGASETLLVANPRHTAALHRARHAVVAAVENHEAGVPTDLLAIDLTAAVNALGEITGETADEELLDRIFSRFCIGK